MDERLQQPLPPIDGGQSLREHLLAKAAEARALCGTPVTPAAILGLLGNRAAVRHPVGVRFDAEPLRGGEFACLEPLGPRPSDGYCLFVHPAFEHQDWLLPLLIAYHIPSVNYGPVVTHVEADLYGAALTGMDREEYYRALCMAADSRTSQRTANPS